MKRLIRYNGGKLLVLEANILYIQQVGWTIYIALSDHTKVCVYSDKERSLKDTVDRIFAHLGEDLLSKDVIIDIPREEMS